VNQAGGAGDVGKVIDTTDHGDLRSGQMTRFHAGQPHRFRWGRTVPQSWCTTSAWGAARSAARLVVVVKVSPARLDWLAALAESDAVFSSRFGVAVEPDWSGFPEAVPAALAAARQRSQDPWGTYLFFDDDGALVGIGGFKGPPTADVVEIGYAVSPSRQGRGIATAAVQYFLAQAVREDVAVVIAHTLAGVNPSTRVLTKTGFVRTATQHDPEVGEVWRWERWLTELDCRTARSPDDDG
jgi:ribosomal-protein-alanine N-acetyltransferase